MSNASINQNIYIEHEVIKQVVADIVRQTPGIANTKKFFFNHNINSKDSSNKVIDISNLENGKIKIEFSVAIHLGHLVIEIPKLLQDQIIKSVKFHFNMDAVVNITVSDVINFK